MKRTAIAVAIAVTALASFATERFTSTSGSFVRIEGTSTMHEWTMEGSTINGQLNLVDAAKRSGSGVLTIPVKSIKSEHDRMDNLMADALKAKTNPEIRYELTSSALAAGDATNFTVKTTGKLTIAGVTRDIAMDVKGAQTPDGKMIVTGQAPIRMSDFGIKPPTAMMNTIKTGNDVKVSFRWVVAAAK